jgi:hypothetical protein
LIVSALIVVRPFATAFKTIRQLRTNPLRRRLDPAAVGERHLFAGP